MINLLSFEVYPPRTLNRRFFTVRGEAPRTPPGMGGASSQPSFLSFERTRVAPSRELPTVGANPHPIVLAPARTVTGLSFEVYSPRTLPGGAGQAPPENRTGQATS